MKLAVLKGFEDKNVIISCLPFVVGRCRSADFIIAHVNVSRNHCEIIKENGSWKVKDYSSSGTYVNAKLVGKGNSVFLNNGDSIRFGPAETNLYWKFYSFDPSIKNSDLDVTRYSQSFFDLNQKKCNATSSNCMGKEHNFKPFENTKLDDNSFDSTVSKKKKEIEMTEVNKNKKPQYRIINECSQYMNNEFSHSSKEGNYEDKSEGHKIQEFKKSKIQNSRTKELQQVQNVLNNLEEKNCVLQEEITAEILSKTEITTTTNLLNNLTDLMESEFQCTICSELFVTAVTLSCAHMFCKYCISQWKKKQKTCPICRKKITTETRSLVVDNYIDKMVENLSIELKKRREAIIKERNDIEPCKKRLRKKANIS